MVEGREGREGIGYRWQVPNVAAVGTFGIVVLHWGVVGRMLSLVLEIVGGVVGEFEGGSVRWSRMIGVEVGDIASLERLFVAKKKSLVEIQRFPIANSAIRTQFHKLLEVQLNFPPPPHPSKQTNPT